ncbi:hypothetical protein PIB30_023688 [Stylosanthes scabra]|uniref:Protein FAR1-RELATED SEQUENCE n=1 Tax=Stylosanthes scabra TaxID=79078 RepID=A0ABU6T9A2_9FABA|nr:hypothetical protein [Stylosanthes scabra]
MEAPAQEFRDGGGEDSTEAEEWSEEGSEHVQEFGDVIVEEDTNDYGDVIGMTPEVVLRKQFWTEKAAYEFYKRFGKCHRFGIRKGDFTKDDAGRRNRRRGSFLMRCSNTVSVGSHYSLALKKCGDDVLGLDNFNSYYDPSLKRARQDLLSKHQIFIVEGDLNLKHAFHETLTLNTTQQVNIHSMKFNLPWLP